jgi:uroporphyrinogen decarboxylase
MRARSLSNEAAKNRAVLDSTGMNSRERVEAALSLEVADRPPIGAWGHDYVAEWDPNKLSTATIAARLRFGWDFIKFQPRATCFAEAFGGNWRPSGNRLEAPIMIDLPKELRFDPSPLFDQVSALRTVAGVRQVQVGGVAHSRDIPVLQTVFSPLTVAGYLFGEDLERSLPYLDLIAGALIEFSHRSVEAGAAGVFYAISGYASSDRMTPAEYEQSFLPFDLKVLESLPSEAWFNVLHLCGANIHFDLAKKLPIQAVSWSIHDEGNPTLEEGIRMSGRAAMGGIGQKTTLLHGTPDEIMAETRRAASANGGRGIILAPGCSVPPQVSEESLRAIHL